FAVLAAGFRGGLRRALTVTGASVALYLCLILVSRPEGLKFYLMRPAYLAITGYLVGYLGEQRMVLESRVRELEAASQRERIARSLHDGYMQALAGVNLRLETSRGLMRPGHEDDGVGFPPGAAPPWSIASRAAELRGDVRLRRDHAGAHVQIELPEC